MTADDLVHSLQRLRDYGRELGQVDREVLNLAAEAIRTPDHTLTEALPNLSTLDALLTVLIDPSKYKAALAKLTEQVKAAKDQRASLAKEAADFDAKRERFEPELKAAREQFDHQIGLERVTWERQVSDTQRSFSSRERMIAEREKETKEAAALVAELKADLDRRITAIRTAAA